jgi:hypothetical protein
VSIAQLTKYAYDTPDQRASKFDMLWLLFKGISIKKSYISKLYHTIYATFKQTIWGLAKDRDSR